MQKYEEKPYNMCLNCAYIGRKCDGPNFLAMTTDRWCEWCRLRKEYLGWTNAHVADLSGISKISVDRVMRGDVKDLRISTMQGITKALVNGSWGQYPCAMDSVVETQTDAKLLEQVEKAEHECKRLQNIIDTNQSENQKKLEFLVKQVTFKEEQMTSKDKLLRERYDFLKRKDKAITILSVALGVVILLMIAAVIIDMTNRDIGFFWLDALMNDHIGKLNT